MAYDGIFPELWGDIAFQEYLATADIANLCNRSYDGTISRKGDTVHVHHFDPASLTIQANWESGNADTDFGDVKTISITEDPAINVEIMDIDRLRTNADLMRETATSMARALANHTDSRIIATVSGTASIPTAVANTYDTLVDAVSVLTAEGVPRSDLWYAASSASYSGLLKDDDVNRAQNSGSNDQVVSGEVRRIAGVNVFEQSVVPHGGVLFHRPSLAFVSQQQVNFQADNMLGGQKKFGTVLGAGLLFGVGVLSLKGCAHITDS